MDEKKKTKKIKQKRWNNRIKIFIDVVDVNSNPKINC